MTQNEHVYAICCRPEVARDVISGENVKTIKGYDVTSEAAGAIDDSIKRKRIRKTGI